MGKATLNLFNLLLACIVLSHKAIAVEVEVFYPEQIPHQVMLELSGTVVAKQNSQLAPLEAGLVKDIYVEAGDKVDAGQPLLALDATLAKLRLSQVEADLLSAEVQQNEAQRQLDEVVSLAKSKVVADSLLAERKANLASANAQLNNAQAQVSLQKEIVNRHTLTAPFSGVIARRNVNLGEWVTQQNQIFQLVSHDSLHLIVELPQEHLKSVSQMKEATAQVIPDVMPELEIELPLTSIVAVSDSLSRTLQIRVDLPSTTELIPGMSARARFNITEKNEYLSWLPRSALKRHPDGGSSVFTVEANFVKRHKIKLIKSEVNRVAVTGIPNNSAVVVSGTELLKDNLPVTTVENKGNR